jgi:Cytochrome c554 and c-prime
MLSAFCRRLAAIALVFAFLFVLLAARPGSRAHSSVAKAGPAKSAQESKEVPTATDIRLTEPGWWPTKGSVDRREYVGAAECERCHSQISANQKSTLMAHALAVASPQSFPELSHGPLRFRIGAYDYELSQTASGGRYSVNDGSQSVSVPIGWIVGHGELGRTYIFQQNGSFFESRVSYYSKFGALDFTTGNPRSVPGRLQTALGRQLFPHEIASCLGCHSTAATTSNHFDASQLVPGVNCEACHGPGAEHVAAMNLQQGEQSATLIMNPARLTPVASVDYCGACHRTSVDVSLMGVSGILTLRFPAYRLERSRCWGSGDARLTCIACHDPHQPLQRDLASYDKNCLACHSVARNAVRGQEHPAAAHGGHSRICPVASKACVTCHMPQYTIPDMHATFTDHKIAIHRQGAPFAE